MALGGTTYTGVTWTVGDTITEAKLDNMVANDQAVDSHASGLTTNNNAGLYQKDSGGNDRLIASVDTGDDLHLGNIENPLIIDSPWDGWISVGETWTYASATTITVPAGALLKYKKGDRIKLTQTTVKYFYVIDVADELLTITGGSDYTLVSATISDNYYSHFDALGFPEYLNYTPTFSATASMTFTSVTPDVSKFRVVDSFVNLLFGFSGTIGGTASNSLLMSLPITSTSVAYQSGGTAYNGSIAIAGYCYTTGSNAACRRYDYSNYGLGANNQFHGQITYGY